jgi:DNA-binding XRE family transcriptional regulator
MYNKKIREAIKKGQLISHKEVLMSFSPKDRKDIKERAKYFMARAEIYRLRKREKLTQADLAKKMDVKREFISRIESGVQNITLETLIKIATAVGKEFKFKFE